MTEPLYGHSLLSLILLIGQTSGLLCELAHASEAIGHANDAPDHASEALAHAYEASVAAYDHSGAPHVAPPHCPRCLLLAASAIPSNDVHVVRVTEPRFASLTRSTPATPRETAFHHCLARGPPDFS